MRKSVCAAAVAVLATVTSVKAEEGASWMVYCEGERSGQVVAYLSRAVWQAPDGRDYGDEMAARTAAMFGDRGQRPIHGCSSVGFADPVLAEYRIEATAALHARVGNRVEFFDMPEVADLIDPKLARTVFSRSAAPLHSR